MQKTDKGLSVTLVSKDPDDKDAQDKYDTIHEVDCLLWAIGREPNTAGLNLSSIVKMNFNLINIICIIHSSIIAMHVTGKILLGKKNNNKLLGSLKDYKLNSIDNIRGMLNPKEQKSFSLLKLETLLLQ